MYILLHAICSCSVKVILSMFAKATSINKKNRKFDVFWIIESFNHPS